MARVTSLFKNHQGLSNPSPLCYQCVSLTNKALKKLQLTNCQSYTRDSFLRVYPVGTEVTSANYNPVYSLQAGAQIIAINAQTKDDYAWLIMSYFTAGRRGDPKAFGYVAKPEYLLSKYQLNELSLSEELSPNHNHVKYPQSSKKLSELQPLSK